jgi:hypothetical protein
MLIMMTMNHDYYNDADDNEEDDGGIVLDDDDDFDNDDDNDDDDDDDDDVNFYEDDDGDDRGSDDYYVMICNDNHQNEMMVELKALKVFLTFTMTLLKILNSLETLIIYKEKHISFFCLDRNEGGVSNSVTVSILQNRERPPVAHFEKGTDCLEQLKGNSPICVSKHVKGYLQ